MVRRYEGLKPFINELMRGDVEEKCQLVVKVDLEQNEEREIQTEKGGVVTIYTPQKYNNNFRTAHPKVATIVSIHGENIDNFKVGQTIVCNHFSFIDDKRQDKTVGQDSESGDDLYVVSRRKVIAKEENGELEPTVGHLLCKPIKDKVYDTFLEVEEDYIRDVCKRYKEYKGFEKDTGIKDFEYVILNTFGDYLFEYKGEDYISVNMNLNSFVGVSDKITRRTDKLIRHFNNHNDLGTN